MRVLKIFIFTVMSRLLFFIFVTLPIIGYSQNTLTGRIIEQTNKPLEYAQVVLQTLDSITIKNGLTGENGVFMLTDLPDGVYNLNVLYFSEVIHSQELNITQDLDLESIVLNTGISLDEVTIRTMPRLKKRVGKYILTNIASSKFAKNKTTYDFFNTIPIVEVSPDGMNLKIRNKGNAIIQINGKNVGGINVALNMLQSIPATKIKKIEIIKNPDSKYDASNKNGIVNIILKNEENEGVKGILSTRVSQSFYNSHRLNGYLSFSKDKWSVTSGITFNNFKKKLQSNSTYDDYVNNITTAIHSDGTNKKKDLTAYINVNYNINENQNVGFQFNSILLDRRNFSNINSSFSNINSTIDSTIIANIEDKNPHNQSLFSNVNYNVQTDDNGSKLNVDYNFYNNKKEQNLFNNFIYSNQENTNFLQNTDIKIKAHNLKTDFSKILSNNDKMNIGASYTYSSIDNDFFSDVLYEVKNLSNLEQTNQFIYKDYTIAGYITYKKIFSKKFQGKIGGRLEYFNSEGKTKTNLDVKKLSNTFLFPSFSVLFIPNYNHEFSLDFGSSIIRPPYNNLNPFIYYTSPTSFRQSNPNLLPTISYELYFNYTFFDDFSFDFEYTRDKNLFNNFDIILSDGNIKTITDNWGNGHDYFFDLTYSKDLLKGNWNFSASLSYNYNTNKGNYNSINLDFDDASYNLRIKNNIILNKKQNTILSLNYSYYSSRRSIIGKINTLHSLTAELSKSFKNFQISAGAYDLARDDLKINERRIKYAFYKNKKYFKTYYINIRFFFGKEKVKRIFDKQNDINKRL